MDWSTDPKMLEGRAFYKLGETVYDHHKKVLIIGIFSCLLLGSLISMGPNWAESWGEGDLESVEAGDLRDSCLLYTSPSPRDKRQSRMPSSA